MSSYRESSYDPNSYERPGQPIRPFNWVQWIGVALIVAGVVALFAYFFGRAGLIPPLVKQVQVSTALAIIGSVLVNSRRHPGSGDVRTTSRRTLIAITVALVAFAIALAAVLYFQGAK